MAAAVSPVSTLRLVSGPAGLSGNPALVEGVGSLEALGAGAGCAAGPVEAAGCANADGDVIGRDGRSANGRALAAYRIGPKCRQPQENEYRPALHWLHSTGSRKTAQAVQWDITRFNTLLRRGCGCLIHAPPKGVSMDRHCQRVLQQIAFGYVVPPRAGYAKCITMR